MQRLNVGATIAAVWSAYRAMFVLLLCLAGVVFVPLSLLTAVLRDKGWIVSVFKLVALFWLTAVATVAVQVKRSDQPLLMVRLLKEGLNSFIPLLQVTFLYIISLGGIIGFGVGAVLVADFIALPVFLVALVFACVLFMRWSLVAPVMMVEKLDVFDTFARSGDLVKGSGWQIFFVFLVMGALVFAADVVLALIGKATGGVAGDTIGAVFTGLIIGPFFALTGAVIYLERQSVKPARPSTV